MRFAVVDVLMPDIAARTRVDLITKVAVIDLLSCHVVDLLRREVPAVVDGHASCAVSKLFELCSASHGADVVAVRHSDVPARRADECTCTAGSRDVARVAAIRYDNGIGIAHDAASRTA